VPEVVEDGVTGHIVDSLDEAICKIGSTLSLNRSRIRRRFEERFTAARMAQDYLKIYHQLIGKPPGPILERVPVSVASEIAP
jgi:glycosyltransferase involved in cell wall biosynthesis